MAKKVKSSTAQSTESRMARLRQRRKESGERQITTYLSAEAAQLLSQMVTFSGTTQRELVDEAVVRLAFDYEHWRVDRPPDDARDGSLGWDTDDDSSHVEVSYEHYVENPSYGKPIPPWIVEAERTRAAERRTSENQLRSDTENEALSVYRRGIDRNRLR